MTNTGLGPDAASTIARSLLANESTKLKKLRMSRSRVEDGGAEALAEYIGSYDSLEYLEIYQNGIREVGATALAQSLLPSAQSGALKHLEINDNFFNSAESSLPALCKLIEEATGLVHLNIDSSNIDEDEKAQQVLAALTQSQSKETLEKFFWNYDAFELDDFIQELLGLLGDGSFPALKHIELAETLEDKSTRNKLRREFKEKGIVLILSDR